MGGSHFTQILHNCIELSIYSEGSVTFNDALNLGADETPYLIYIFRQHYENKEKGRQDVIKAGFDYASKALDQLFKLLNNLGKRRRPGE